MEIKSRCCFDKNSLLQQSVWESSFTFRSQQPTRKHVVKHLLDHHSLTQCCPPYVLLGAPYASSERTTILSHAKRNRSNQGEQACSQHDLLSVSGCHCLLDSSHSMQSCLGRTHWADLDLYTSGYLRSYEEVRTTRLIHKTPRIRKTDRGLFFLLNHKSKIDNILFVVYYRAITNSHKFSPSIFYRKAKALI